MDGALVPPVFVSAFLHKPPQSEQQLFFFAILDFALKGFRVRGVTLNPEA